VASGCPRAGGKRPPGRRAAHHDPPPPPPKPPPEKPPEKPENPPPAPWLLLVLGRLTDAWWKLPMSRLRHPISQYVVNICPGLAAYQLGGVV
jgi:hypothetical protein